MAIGGGDSAVLGIPALPAAPPQGRRRGLGTRVTRPSMSWEGRLFLRGRLHHFPMVDGWPTWIRTMNKGFKDPCVTITPSAINGRKLWGPADPANSFFGEVWVRTWPGLPTPAAQGDDGISVEWEWISAVDRAAGLPPGG